MSGCDPLRYEDHGEHARGGLGRVLAKRDRKLDRTVAIKELLTRSPRAEARFAREASITARLEHPGVVPIYEGGTWPDGTPFYAMKLIAGDSLSDRIKATERFDDRLSLIPHVLAVAEAIAYAHSEGVIHRDLKPANVIVGPYGETVVVDWGLAKQLDAAEIGADDRADPTGSGPYRDAPDDALTVDGDVLGTPTYMAPEQARGEAVDERADVYALGAILYAVLAGRPPYSASSSKQAMTELLARPPEPIANVVPVRAELAAIVDKAMAREPDRRYPDASALRDDLRRYQAGQMVRAHHYTAVERLWRGLRRARWALALASLLALGGLAAYGLTRETASLADLCKQGQTDASAMWNADVKARVAAALRKTGVPYADETVARVDGGLDDYVARYGVAHAKACNATARRGEQSVELFDLRIQCLRDRLDEAQALVDLLAEADEVVAKRAANAVASLRSFAPCAEPDYLLARVKPPDDPGQAEAVRAIRADLARSRALAQTERWSEAADVAAAALERARDVGFEPAVAAALRAHGVALALQSKADEAVPILEDAFYRLVRVGAIGEAIDAATVMTQTVATGKSDEASERWARLAEALIGQEGDDPKELGLLHRARARAARTRGDFARVLEHERAALDAFGRSTDDVRALRGQTLANIAGALIRTGHADEALAFAREAVAVIEDAVGARHPNMGFALNLLGQAQWLGSERDAAPDTFARSVEIYESVLGPKHPQLASSLNNLAVVLSGVDRWDEALVSATRAKELWETHYGPDNVDVSYAIIEMARAHRGKGEHAAAAALLERAVEIRVNAYGPNHGTVAYAWEQLCRARLAAGELDAAERAARAAVDIERGLDAKGKHTAGAYELLGDVLAEADKPAAARASYERALAIRTSPTDRAAVRFGIAKTHAEAKAVELARAALAEAKSDDEPDAELIGEIESWLAGR